MLTSSAFNCDVADESALRSLGHAARSAGLSPTLVDVLHDAAAPTVVRVRAYAILGRRLTFAS